MIVNKLVLRKRAFALVAAAGLLFFQPSEPATAQTAKAVKFNNEGVLDLNKKNFISAEDKFTKALKIDPTFKKARHNLELTYRSLGLQKMNDKPAEALKMFHKAWMLDFSNAKTRQNMDTIIRKMGKNPNAYADRVQLGDTARRVGDFTGAIVEYSFALDIEDSAEAHEKLGDVYCIVDRCEKADKQYQIALNKNRTPELEAKLQKARSCVSSNQTSK